MVSETSSAPAVSKATSLIELELIVNSSATPPTSPLRELVVKLEVSSELIKAIRELKEAIIMAFSMSRRQVTIIYTFP